MNRLPFSAYDFFGYLAAGFLLLAAADFASEGGWLLRDDLEPVSVFLFIVVAYILGHILANLSGFLLESWIVRRILGSPEELLLHERRRGLRSFLFPGFYRPLPAETGRRVLERAQARGVSGQAGRGLFLHCFGVVKSHQDTMARLDTFLNLYGFARNVSFACVAAAVLLWLGSHDPSHAYGDEASRLSWVGLFVALGMFYRYLKFFRQYTYEVFITYAETAD